MSPKRILVHIDAGSISEARMSAAVEITKYFSATLGAVFVEPLVATADTPTELLVSAASGAAACHRESINTPDELLLQKQKNISAQLASAEDALAPHARMESIGVCGSLYENFVASCLINDLTIVGKDLVFWDDPLVSVSNPVLKVAVRSASPVLSVPTQGLETFPPRRPIFIWNGSRECIRALRDALPFLKESTNLSIYSMVEDEYFGTPHRHELPDSLLKYLDLNELDANPINSEPGNVAKSDRSSVKKTIARDILQSIDRDKNDFIIMGAYGHSHVREMLLGSTVRALLKEAHIPILLSH